MSLLKTLTRQAQKPENQRRAMRLLQSKTGKGAGRQQPGRSGLLGMLSKSQPTSRSRWGR